jgi:hypothetical protein
LNRLPIIAVAVACACWFPAAPAAAPDLEALMTRVGARLARGYDRAQRVTGFERSMIQSIKRDRSADGFARTVESELRVEFGAAEDGMPGDPRVVRDVRRINGRTPRARDANDRSGCTDPPPQSAEPLAFLLPAHRDEYRFTSVRDGRERQRAVFIVDFRSVSRTSRPVLIEDERGHDDCFDWSGPIATVGRIWVDAATDEVLRVDRHLVAPVDVRVPWPLQSRYRFEPWVVIDRDDLVIRRKAIAFSDPDEVIVLPESIESLTILRSGLQSTRGIATFSDYRRFVTTGRIVKDP